MYMILYDQKNVYESNVHPTMEMYHQTNVLQLVSFSFLNQEVLISKVLISSLTVPLNEYYTARIQISRALM